MSNMKVSFNENGVSVAGTGIDPAAIPQQDNQTVNPVLKATFGDTVRPQPQKFQQRRAVDHVKPDSADPVVPNIIHLVKVGGIPIINAANIISGRIRSHFIKAIRFAEGQTMQYEVQSFKYLDEILFNDLTFIFASIIQFGSMNSIPLGNVVKMITDTASIIDYFISKEDMEEIKQILIEVYHAF